MSARKTPRASTSAQDVETRLRRGTLALLEAEGFGALSVRRIASASGRSTMCVYSHFGGVGHLLAAVFDDAAQLLLQALEGPAQDAPERYVQWAVEHPQAYRLLFEADLAALGLDPALRPPVIEQSAAAFGEREEGHRRWAMAHGLATLDRAASRAAAPAGRRQRLGLVASLLSRC